MGYVNLSYDIGKTPEKVSGPKIFFGSDLEALKVGLPENFGTLMIMDHKDIGLSFHIQKI